MLMVSFSFVQKWGHEIQERIPEWRHFISALQVNSMWRHVEYLPLSLSARLVISKFNASLSHNGATIGGSVGGGLEPGEVLGFQF